MLAIVLRRQVVLSVDATTAVSAAALQKRYVVSVALSVGFTARPREQRRVIQKLLAKSYMSYCQY